jgi:ABC-type uncharacterized transport system substrate-binding protein
MTFAPAAMLDFSATMDVTRRRFVTAGTAAALLFAGTRPAASQPAGRASRVAVVWAVPSCAPYRAVLERRLAELGWIEDRNIVFEHRCADVPASLPALAEDAVKSRPDIIVAASMRAIVPAARATSTIPIVMMWGHDLKEEASP